jgi:hypothetical protein
MPGQAHSEWRWYVVIRIDVSSRSSPSPSSTQRGINANVDVSVSYNIRGVAYPYGINTARAFVPQRKIGSISGSPSGVCRITTLAGWYADRFII